MKPFIVDDNEYRRLHFSLRFTQSQMRLGAPDELILPYTQTMMACLLFQPRPRHILILGLGGGSLTKFCYRQLPRSRITTVEIDREIIALAPEFLVPAPDERLRIVHADAADYVAACGPAADIVLLDACDRQGIAWTVCNEDFFHALRLRLRPGGVLVMNLLGASRHSCDVIDMIAEVFNGQTLVLKVPPGSNRIVFGFHDADWKPDWSAIRQQAKRLAKLHPLNFVEYAQRLECTHQFAVPPRTRPRP